MNFNNGSNLPNLVNNPDAIGPRPLTNIEKNIDIGGPVYGENLEYGGLRKPVELGPAPMPAMQFRQPAMMGIDNIQAGMQQVAGPAPMPAIPGHVGPTSTDLGPGYGPYDIARYGPW
jgi:hypothetical protein